MAHVHGAKLAEAAKTIAEEAPCPFHAAGEMMGQGGGMNMGGMMGSGMGGMMEHASGMGMGGMMGSGMGEMMGSGAGGMMMGPGMGMGMGAMLKPKAMAAGVATGAAVTASSATSHSLLRRIVTHPLVLFGAGLAVGYLIHKYREEIIQKATEATD